MSFTAPKVKGSVPFGRGNAFGHLPVGSDGNILVADSSGPSGVNWSSSALAVGAGVGLGGFWMYGNGEDGNVTLVGNTVLAAGDSVKRYNNLNLGGFDLTFDSTDFYAVVYVKDTISGGGNIVAENRGSGTFNAGGLGGLSPAGDGGAGAAAFYVFARNITGVTQISAAGGGGIAGGGPSIFLLPGAVSEYASDIIFKSKSYPSPSAPNTQAGFHFGPGVGFGGDGSPPTVSVANRQEINRTAKDWLRMVVMNGFSDYTAGAPPDERWSRSNGGGGGAAGFGPNLGPVMFVTAGGGGGAGGAGIIGNGGGGGGAAAVLLTLVAGESSTSGAGGGGGGGGGVAILVTDTVTAATSVNTSGGIGGAGSGGSGVPADPGGGGGGGGGGGYSLAIVRSGVGFVSASAAGGSAGLGGGGGTPGAAGSTGFPGIAAVLASA